MIAPLALLCWAVAPHAPVIAILVTSVTTCPAGTMPLAVGVFIPTAHNLQKKNPGSPEGPEAQLGRLALGYLKRDAGCNAMREFIAQEVPHDGAR